ncbi:hypothetical protein HDV01_004113 [Terramyces sp. JEL0728]|nr:hypothetical protein HDV01_004113 [Terramyces sp. JEL0728]
MKTKVTNLSGIISHMEFISGVELAHLNVTKILEKEPGNLGCFVDLLWELFLAKMRTEPLENYVDENTNITGKTSDLMDDTSLLEKLGDYSGLDSDFESSRPTTRVLGNKHLQVWLNKVQDDVERFANTHAAKVPKKEKKLRFKDASFDNGPLEIKPEDNPHLAALKLKFMSLQKNKPSKRNVASSLVEILQMHAKILKKDAPKLATRKEEPLQRPIAHSPILDRNLSKDSLDQELGYAADAIPKREADNLPEKNLDAFFDHIKAHVPILRNATERDYEMAMKSQISLTKKALDNRLWQQKVDLQKEFESIKDTAPLDTLLKQIEHENRAKVKREEILSLKNANSALQSQYRRVKRLQYRQKTVIDENKRRQRNQALKEEQFTNGLVNQYMESQRRSLVEYRKEESELKKQLLQKRQQESDKKTFVLEQQIEMIKEEIQRLQLEEELIRKSEREVIFSDLGNIKADKGNKENREGQAQTAER